RNNIMVTLHEVITFLVSMQISISSLQTHNVNRCGRSRHLARKLSLRRKRSSPNVFEMAATETITSIILIKLIRVSLGTVRHPRRFKIVVIDIQITLKQMLRDFIGIRVNRAKKSGMVNITSSVNSRERSGINTILHELNPLFTINVTMRDIKSKNVYSRVNSKATTQWRKTESANGVHLEGVASDNRSSWNGNKTTNLTSKEAKMGKVMRHTLGASLNIRHNLSSSKGPKPLQLKLLTTYIPKPIAFTQGKREQFSGFNRTLDAINNVFRKFSAFHDETGRLNVDGMNIISNDGSNKLNRSRKARVSYKVQRTINASLNAATSTRAVSSNPNFRSEQLSRFNRTFDAINNVFRKFMAFQEETGRLNVDGMNIISNDGSNNLNRSRKARVSYKVQRTINASLNAPTCARAGSRDGIP